MSKKISELDPVSDLFDGCCFPLVQNGETVKITYETFKNQLYEDIANDIDTKIEAKIINKVDKIPNKGLSSNDFTDEYKEMLDEIPDTIYANGADYAEIATWDDGNPNKENRLYRFVTLKASGRKIGIANSTDQIVGVTSSKAAFVGNAKDYDEEDKTKAIVGIIGVVSVKTKDSTIKANDRVMSDDNGYAVKSTNNCGYRVLQVLEDNLLEIVISPNTDMIQRIKDDMTDLEKLISAIPKFKIEVVDELPTTGEVATVYLLTSGEDEPNLYEEYIYVNNAWEKLGSQTVDLTGYAKEEWVEEKIPKKTSQLQNDSNFISDPTYVHTDNNFTTDEKNKINNNTENIKKLKEIPNNLWKCYSGGFVTVDGNVGSAGANKECVGEFIYVETGERIVCTTFAKLTDSETPWIGVGLYDSNKNFIRRYTTSVVQDVKDGITICNLNIDIPEGVSYIRPSARLQNNGKIYVCKGTYEVKNMSDSEHLVSDYICPLLLGTNDVVKFSKNSKTMTIPRDTLISYINKAGKREMVQLTSSDVEVSLALSSSAILVFANPNTKAITTKIFNDNISQEFRENNLLIAYVRLAGNTILIPTINCKYEIIEDMFRDVVNTYALMLPSSTLETYTTIDTAKKTITIPRDTLIIDKRLKNGWISLQETNLSYSSYTTSALVIYYDLSSETVKIGIYTDKFLPNEKIILFTFRTIMKSVFSPSPIYIDGKLFGKIDENPLKGTAFIKSINHRGYNSVAPENTLPAYKLSKQKGFEIVETDVSFTSDNVPVLLHDSTIDRTSNGTGEISQMTFAEVRTLDFGSWKSSKYVGTKIPSFEEFIKQCRNLGLKVYAELKGSPTDEQLKTCCDIVIRYNMQDKVSWISFDSSALNYVKEYITNARLGFLVGSVTSNSISTALGLKNGSNEVFLNCSSISSELILQCLNSKLPVEMWTINSESAIVNTDGYISGITSDYLKAEDVLYNSEIAKN